MPGLSWLRNIAFLRMAARVDPSVWNTIDEVYRLIPDLFDLHDLDRLPRNDSPQLRAVLNVFQSSHFFSATPMNNSKLHQAPED
jgi:hypothetical protein